MPPLPRELNLATSSYSIAGLEWGAATDRPLLALHGWLDNAASYSRLAPLLPGYHVAAIDFPGHGRSGHKASFSPYLFLDYARVALEAADALGWAQFNLVGHSLGANVSVVLAAIAPERVSRLALIEGIGPMAEPPEAAPRRLARYVRHMATLRGRSLPVYATAAEATRARLQASPMEPRSAALIVDRNLKPVEGGVSWRTDQKLTLTSPYYLTEEQVRAYLDVIEAPTLLVLGDRGLLVTRAVVADRCAGIARLRTVTLEGGHHLHLDRPGPVADALLDFLADR